MRTVVRIADLCFMHEQLLKMDATRVRVSDALGKVQDSILRTVEGLRTDETESFFVDGVKAALDAMGYKPPESS